MKYLVLTVCAALAACSDTTLTRGAAHVVVSTNLQNTGIDEVTLTVTGDNIATPIVHDLDSTTDVEWQGTVFDLPAGNTHFDVTAYDSNGNPLLTGSADTTIVQGQTALVAIVLQQTVTPPPFTNNAPVIKSLTASTDEPQVGENVTLTTVAIDPDGDPLTYTWSTPDGPLDASGPTITWTAPQQTGPVTITVTVDDGRGGNASISITLTVIDGQGNAQVTVYANFTPQVTALSASPGLIDAGGTTQLSLTVENLDGDDLFYVWQADCAGEFSDATAAQPTFTLDSLPEEGFCTLSVTVTDAHQASGTGSIGISTGPGPTPVFAPVIDLAYQSLLNVSPGDRVVFDITAHDPQGSPLSYAWTAHDVGSLQFESDTAFFEPPRELSGPVNVTVTVSNKLKLSTSMTFTVSPAAVVIGNNCPSLGEAAPDQSTAQFAQGGQQPLDPSQVWAQTFTPSLTGRLSGVNLPLTVENDDFFNQGSPSVNVTVSIRATATGTAGVSNGFDYSTQQARILPFGPDLAAQSFTVASGTPSGEVDFDNPPMLTAGTTYAIVIAFTAPDQVRLDWSIGTSHNSDAYPNGSIYFSTDGGWDDYGYQPNLSPTGGVDYYDATFTTIMRACLQHAP